MKSITIQKIQAVRKSFTHNARLRQEFGEKVVETSWSEIKQNLIKNHKKKVFDTSKDLKSLRISLKQIEADSGSQVNHIKGRIKVFDVKDNDLIYFATYTERVKKETTRRKQSKESSKVKKDTQRSLENNSKSIFGENKRVSFSVRADSGERGKSRFKPLDPKWRTLEGSNLDRSLGDILEEKDQSIPDENLKLRTSLSLTPALDPKSKLSSTRPSSTQHETRELSKVGALNLTTSLYHEHCFNIKDDPVTVKILESNDYRLLFVMVLEKTIIFYKFIKGVDYMQEKAPLSTICSHDIPDHILKRNEQKTVGEALGLGVPYQKPSHDKFVSFLYFGKGQYALTMNNGEFFVGLFPINKEQEEEDSSFFAPVDASPKLKKHSVRSMTRFTTGTINYFFCASLNRIITCEPIKNQFFAYSDPVVQNVKVVGRIEAYQDTAISEIQAFMASYLVTACEAGRLKVWKITPKTTFGCDIELVQRFSEFEGFGIIRLVSNDRFLVAGGSNGFSYIYGLDKQDIGEKRSIEGLQKGSVVLREYNKIKTIISQAKSVLINSDNKIFSSYGSEVKISYPTYLMQECDFDDLIMIPKRKIGVAQLKQSFKDLSNPAKIEHESKIKKLEYFTFKSGSRTYEYILVYNEYAKNTGYVSLWSRFNQQALKRSNLPLESNQGSQAEKGARNGPRSVAGPRMKSTKKMMKTFKSLMTSQPSKRKEDPFSINKMTKALGNFMRNQKKKSSRFEFVRMETNQNHLKIQFNDQKKEEEKEKSQQKNSWQLSQEFNFLVNSDGFTVSEDGSCLAMINQSTLSLLVFDISQKFKKRMMSGLQTIKKLLALSLGQGLVSFQDLNTKKNFHLSQELKDVFRDQFWIKNSISVNRDGSLLSVIDYSDQSVKVWARLENSGLGPNSKKFVFVNSVFKLYKPFNIKLRQEEYFLAVKIDWVEKKSGIGILAPKSYSKLPSIERGDSGKAQQDREICLQITRLDGVDIVNFNFRNGSKLENSHNKILAKGLRLKFAQWSESEKLVCFHPELGFIASENEEKISDNQIFKKLIIRIIDMDALNDAKEIMSDMVLSQEFHTEDKTSQQTHSQKQEDDFSKVDEYAFPGENIKYFEILEAKIHQILDFSYFGVNNSTELAIKVFKKKFQRTSKSIGSRIQGHQIEYLTQQSRVRSLNGFPLKSRSMKFDDIKDTSTEPIPIYLNAFHRSVTQLGGSYYQIYKLSKDLKFVLVMKLESEQGLCFDHHLRFVANASIKENNKVYINESKYEAGKLPRCSNLYRYLIEVFEGDKNFINPDKLDSLCEYLKKNESAYNELVIHKEINIILLCVLSESAATLKKGLDYFGYFKAIYQNPEKSNEHSQISFIKKVKKKLKKKLEDIAKLKKKIRRSVAIANKPPKQAKTPSKKEEKKTYKDESYKEDPLRVAIQMNNLSLVDEFAEYFKQNPISGSQFSEDLLFKFLESNSKKIQKVAVENFFVKGLNEEGLYISDSVPLGREGFLMIKTDNFERDVEFKKQLNSLSEWANQTHKQRSVEFLTTSIPIDLSLHTKFTKKFSELYLQSEPEIITSKLKIIVRDTWLRNKKFIFLYSLINWISLGSLLAWVVWFEYQFWVFIIAVTGHSLIIIFESLVVFRSSKSLLSSWKFWILACDVFTLIVFITSFRVTTDYIFNVIKFSTKIYNVLVTALLSYHLGHSLVMWRFWDKNRYLVAMIFKAIHEMASFLTILMFTVFSFTMIQIQVKKNLLNTEVETTLSFWESFKISYDLAYSNFPPSGEMHSVQYFHYILSTIFLPLVLMNLFIAIIWNTFSEVKSQREVTDYAEMASIIYEFSVVSNFCSEIFGWKTQKGFYHVIVKKEKEGSITAEPESTEQLVAGVGSGDDIGKLIELNIKTLERLDRLEKQQKGIVDGLSSVKEDNMALILKMKGAEDLLNQLNIERDRGSISYEFEDEEGEN